MRPLNIALLAAVIAVSDSCVSAKGKNLPPAIQITEATSQRTIGGRRETGIFTNYRIKVIWKGSSKPIALAFRPDNDTWLDAHFARNERKPMFAGSNDYMDIETKAPFKDIKTGERLLVSIERHSHDLVPSAASTMPVMSLYYQTADAPGRWKTVPVNPRKLPDINMP